MLGVLQMHETIEVQVDVTFASGTTHDAPTQNLAD